MSEYEKQVIQLTKFKPADYADHQDYIAALVRHTDLWLQKHDKTGAIFDGWDNALADWFDEVVHILNDGEGPLPDFPDRLEPIIDIPPVEDPEPPIPEGGVPEPPAEEPLPQYTADDVPIEPPPIPGTAGALIPGKSKKWGVKINTRIPTPYDYLSGERDRYGIIVGTKTHDAVLMYERGTSARELLKALGGRHYNILGRLQRDGHKVVRLANHRFRVTHRDDVAKAKEAKEKEEAKDGSKDQ